MHKPSAYGCGEDPLHQEATRRVSSPTVLSALPVAGDVEMRPSGVHAHAPARAISISAFASSWYVRPLIIHVVV
ncbi:unnamed protein product [Peniophora sp. CBMAI 1063]|nr:unnamed protein product [Peniophora sp. CBMAI 1063]